MLRAAIVITNLKHQKTRHATVWGPSVWHLMHVIIVAVRNLNWFLHCFFFNLWTPALMQLFNIAVSLLWGSTPQRYVMKIMNGEAAGIWKETIYGWVYEFCNDAVSVTV
jgi:hypothetical protein